MVRLEAGFSVAQERVVVIGAGIGGLAAALRLAHAGLDVTVVERAARPGGKMASVRVGDSRVETGPTVFTMRWVFEELFAESGAAFEEHATLAPAGLLARHAWTRDERLTCPPISTPRRPRSRLCRSREAEGYRRFCARSAEVYRTLEGPFIREGRTSPTGLAQRVGISGLGDLWRIQPFATLWSALGTFFRDPRLLQLFGRYATYCGASPFTAPATLMLVAHVEQAGIWTVAGGMSALAKAVADLAAQRGATFRYGAHVDRIVTAGGRVSGVILADGETIPADHVVCNADASALGAGLFRPGGGADGRAPGAAERSLSALTLAAVARARRLSAGPSQRVLSRAITGPSSTRSAPAAPARRPHGLHLRPGPDRVRCGAHRAGAPAPARQRPGRRPGPPADALGDRDMRDESEPPPGSLRSDLGDGLAPS